MWGEHIRRQNMSMSHFKTQNTKLLKRVVKRMYLSIISTCHEPKVFIRF